MTESTSPKIETCRLRAFSNNTILDTISGSPSTCENEKSVYFNENPLQFQYDFEFHFKFGVSIEKNKFNNKTYAVPHFGVVDVDIIVSRVLTTKSM